MAEIVAGVVAVAQQVPRLLGRSFLGAVAGFFAGGMVGTVLALVAQGLASTSPGGWTAFALGAASTLVCAAGGAVVGALRGCSRAVVRMVEELDLVAALYDKVRPHLRAYAQRLRQGAHSVASRAEALRALGTEKAEAASAPALAERAERYIASLIHAALAGGLLAALLGRGRSADEVTEWSEVESAGLARSREALGDLIGRMFHGPIVLTLLLTALCATAPHVAHGIMS